MAKGYFVTFEGGEGSGKSTQIGMLAKRTEAEGINVLCLREPGGTIVGDKVRDLLLDPAHTGLDNRAELLLYEASRAELVGTRIRRALKDGEVVICDRFFDSTTAYQGYARGLPLDVLGILNMFATGGLVPDLTFLNDVEPILGLERATGGGADRLEQEEIGFHVRVREGFLAIASEEPDRFFKVDASLTPEEMHEITWNEFIRRYKAR